MNTRRQLAAILHADVADSTALVHRNESLAHRRIRSAFHRLSESIEMYAGTTHEIRGDALVATFSRPSDSVCAALAFQTANHRRNGGLGDNVRPSLRIGISLGEVVIADGTLTGPGVVLAQRLEQLAHPNGVVVQGTARETVPTRLPFEFDSLGEQILKGFDQPVRAFVVRLKAGEALPEPESELAEGPGASMSVGHSPEIHDKPSIAVLPFTNMSGDPQQDYFADGITDDIIMTLSRFRDLVVIARNSSFAYKGKAITIPTISHELGVRYLLEGSVQKSGEQIRINVQLVDGPSGRQLWGERYQRRVDDIFELQDEVTEATVSALAMSRGGRLRQAWQTLKRTTKPQDLKAFDYLIRGMDAWDCLTKEDNLRARSLLEEAIRLDPNYAKAYSKLAWTHYADAVEGFGDDYEGSLAKGKECAAQAVAMDDAESWAHWALAAGYAYEGRFDLAIPEFETTIELNPNDADALIDYGLFMSYAGRVDVGLDAARKALRLNPHHPDWYKLNLAQICFDAHQYEDAIRSIGEASSLETPLALMYLAASLAGLGKFSEAEKTIERALVLDPEATIRKWCNSRMAPYQQPGDLEHFRQHLRRAGLPD